VGGKLNYTTTTTTTTRENVVISFSTFMTTEDIHIYSTFLYGVEVRIYKPANSLEV
jgi:hypothetical protein